MIERRDRTSARDGAERSPSAGETCIDLAMPDAVSRAIEEECASLQTATGTSRKEDTLLSKGIRTARTGKTNRSLKGLQIHPCPHNCGKNPYSRREHARRHHANAHSDCFVDHPELWAGDPASARQSSPLLDVETSVAPARQRSYPSPYSSAIPEYQQPSHTVAHQDEWILHRPPSASIAPRHEGILELTANNMCLSCRDSGKSACHIGSKQACLACVELNQTCLFAREIPVVAPYSAIPFDVLQGIPSSTTFSIANARTYSTSSRMEPDEQAGYISAHRPRGYASSYYYNASAPRYQGYPAVLASEPSRGSREPMTYHSGSSRGSDAPTAYSTAFPYSPRASRRSEVEEQFNQRTP